MHQRSKRPHTFQGSKNVSLCTVFLAIQCIWSKCIHNGLLQNSTVVLPTSTGTTDHGCLEIGFSIKPSYGSVLWFEEVVHCSQTSLRHSSHHSPRGGMLFGSMLVLSQRILAAGWWWTRKAIRQWNDLFLVSYSKPRTSGRAPGTDHHAPGHACSGLMLSPLHNILAFPFGRFQLYG